MPPKNKQNNQRIPRPKGSTELSILYNKDKSTTNLNELQNHIINHYVNTNYTYNGIKLNIEQFSMITNIPIDMVYPIIYNKEQTLFTMLSDEERFNVSGVFKNMLFNGSLNAHIAVQQHVAAMLQSQGDSYKPFISSEVTKALKLYLDSNDSIARVHQQMFGTQGPMFQINNINNQQNTLSVSEAHMLLNNDKTNLPLLEDNEARQQLYLQHNISDLPEINANMQQNIDTSREGISFNVPLVDDALVTSEDEDLGHINRRADEYEIDLDQDEV